MRDWWEGILRCPVCGAAVHRDAGALFCDGARRHGFDFGAAGYVNLASAKAAGGGDDAELIRARTAFLEAGHYAPVAEAICEMLQRYCPGGAVLDAGCGEGYYANLMAAQGHRVLGIDLSKRGILHAAKCAKRAQNDALFAVAGIFALPVADASLDAVVSLFAPVAEEEFLRVLRPGGVLVLAGAAPRHLYSLKKVLYDTPYLNEKRADAPTEMALIAENRLSYQAPLDAAALQSLFAMTPYFYRTSRQGKERLLATTSLDVDVDVEIAVYQKQ